MLPASQRPEVRTELGARLHRARHDCIRLRRRLEEHLPEECLGERRVTELRDGRLRICLGSVRIAECVAAAVDENDTRRPLRNEASCFQHHAAAHAVADEEQPLQLKVVDQRRDIPAVVLDRALVRPAGRLAMAAQVARDDFVRPLEMIELRAPVFRRAGEAVDEDEGW